MNRCAFSQGTLEAAVWSACETFRGTVEPDLYKRYVVTLLFLKAISDAWEEHEERYRAEHGQHPELVEELLRNERFVLPPGANFYALHEARYQPGNGERIDKALHAIEEANLGKLHDVFHDISFNATELGDEAQKNEMLRQLLEDFARPELNLRESRVGRLEVIGNACEFLIRNLSCASGKKAGEFHTPPEVSRLIAALMDPQPGDDICDPACGCGSLLVKCGQWVRAHHGTGRYALFGQEALGSTWALARMNLFLHAQDNHRLEWGDTLRNPRLLDERGGLRHFDVVVAHLPFSSGTWTLEHAIADKYKRFRRGVPPRTRADYAFILHMVETLKPGNGRMAVVVPHGVLFRGAAEGKIRQQLIDENLLDLVIGLPEKLFHGTGIAAAVLVFRMHKADDKVLFIDASRSFQHGKNQNVLRPQDLERIVQTANARQGVDKYAHLASREEIAGNGYNLNIPRYVSTFEEQAAIDLVAVREERSKLLAELAALEQQMEASLRQLGHE